MLIEIVLAHDILGLPYPGACPHGYSTHSLQIYKEIEERTEKLIALLKEIEAA